MLSPDERLEYLKDLYCPLKREAKLSPNPVIEAVCLLIEMYLDSQGLYGTLRELDKWEIDA